MSLFQRGDFTLHSGEKSGFKIDCDALTDGDLETIACMIAERVPNFGSVEGVPSGGLRLSSALEKYVTVGQLLIVDDVYTTGASMETQRRNRQAQGAVIFTRMEPSPWVMPLFTLFPMLGTTNHV